MRRAIVVLLSFIFLTAGSVGSVQAQMLGYFGSYDVVGSNGKMYRVDLGADVEYFPLPIHKDKLLNIRARAYSLSNPSKNIKFWYYFARGRNRNPGSSTWYDINGGYYPYWGKQFYSNKSSYDSGWQYIAAWNANNVTAYNAYGTMMVESYVEIYEDGVRVRNAYIYRAW